MSAALSRLRRARQAALAVVEREDAPGDRRSGSPCRASRGSSRPRNFARWKRSAIASCRSRRIGRRCRSRRWSTPSSTKMAATAIATIACRRCARPGSAASRASTAEARRRHNVGFPELDGAEQDALLRAVQDGEFAGDWDGMPPAVFFAKRLLFDIVTAVLRAPDRVERDRLWRSGEPARLCADGFRPARPVGGGGGDTRQRGGSPQGKCPPRLTDG